MENKEEKPQFSKRLKKELKENGGLKKLNIDKKKLIWVFVTVVLLFLLIFVLWRSYSFNRKADTESQNTGAPITPMEEKSTETEEQKEEIQTQETYSVEEGDTLSTIAEKFDVSWQKLAEANNLTEDSVLRIGQKLVIPK